MDQAPSHEQHGTVPEPTTPGHSPISPSDKVRALLPTALCERLEGLLEAMRKGESERSAAGSQSLSEQLETLRTDIASVPAIMQDKTAGEEVEDLLGRMALAIERPDLVQLQAPPRIDPDETDKGEKPEAEKSPEAAAAKPPEKEQIPGLDSTSPVDQVAALLPEDLTSRKALLGKVADFERSVLAYEGGKTIAAAFVQGELRKIFTELRDSLSSEKGQQAVLAIGDALLKRIDPALELGIPLSVRDTAAGGAGQVLDVEHLPGREEPTAGVTTEPKQDGGRGQAAPASERALVAKLEAWGSADSSKEALAIEVPQQIMDDAQKIGSWIGDRDTFHYIHPAYIISGVRQLFSRLSDCTEDADRRNALVEMEIETLSSISPNAGLARRGERIHEGSLSENVPGVEKPAPAPTPEETPAEETEKSSENPITLHTKNEYVRRAVRMLRGVYSRSAGSTGSGELDVFISTKFNPLVAKIDSLLSAAKLGKEVPEGSEAILALVDKRRDGFAEHIESLCTDPKELAVLTRAVHRSFGVLSAQAQRALHPEKTDDMAEYEKFCQRLSKGEYTVDVEKRAGEVLLIVSHRNGAEIAFGIGSTEEHPLAPLSRLQGLARSVQVSGWDLFRNGSRTVETEGRSWRSLQELSGGRIAAARNVRFQGAVLKGLNMSQADIENVQMEGCTLYATKMVGMQATGFVMNRCDAPGLDMRNAELAHGSRLTGNKFHGSNFAQADIHDSSFRNNIAPQSNLAMHADAFRKVQARWNARNQPGSRSWFLDRAALIGERRDIITMAGQFKGTKFTDGAFGTNESKFDKNAYFIAPDKLPRYQRPSLSPDALVSRLQDIGVRHAPTGAHVGPDGTDELQVLRRTRRPDGSVVEELLALAYQSLDDGTYFAFTKIRGPDGSWIDAPGEDEKKGKKSKNGESAPAPAEPVRVPASQADAFLAHWKLG